MRVLFRCAGQIVWDGEMARSGLVWGSPEDVGSWWIEEPSRVLVMASAVAAGEGRLLVVAADLGMDEVQRLRHARGKGPVTVEIAERCVARNVQPAA